jgi:trehalose 6-phosphate phosphatase
VVVSSLLDRLAEAPDRAAILLDVDGVLAPIVARPEDARVPDETRAELHRLAARYGLVACVTGRESDDARRIVGVDELVYVGEHGLELEPEAEEWVDRIARFADETAEWAAERKRLTLSFHYRLADDEDAAVTTLEGVAARALAAGFIPRWGRKVLEIRPPVEAHKGTAIRRLLALHGLERALYAGDDTTDIDGFAALDGLELAIRIAVASTEGPERLREAADLIVDGPAAFLYLLRQL